MKAKLAIILAITAGVSGCANGRMVCEWQTEDERFQELINQVLEERKHDEA